MINSTYNELTLENLLKIVDKFQNNNSRWKLTIRKTVDMESNLSSKVFKKLVKNLGFDYSKFELKEKLIDEKLLSKRNIIAHGGYEKIDIEQLKEVYTIIIGVMEDFKDQIYDCARDKKYLESSNS